MYVDEFSRGANAFKRQRPTISRCYRSERVCTFRQHSLIIDTKLLISHLILSFCAIHTKVWKSIVYLIRIALYWARPDIQAQTALRVSLTLKSHNRRTSAWQHRKYGVSPLIFSCFTPLFHTHFNQL